MEIILSADGNGTATLPIEIISDVNGFVIVRASGFKLKWVFPSKSSVL